MEEEEDRVKGCKVVAAALLLLLPLVDVDNLELSDQIRAVLEVARLSRLISDWHSQWR